MHKRIAKILLAVLGAVLAALALPMISNELLLRELLIAPVVMAGIGVLLWGWLPSTPNSVAGRRKMLLLGAMIISAIIYCGAAIWYYMEHRVGAANPAVVASAGAPAAALPLVAPTTPSQPTSDQGAHPQPAPPAHHVAPPARQRGTASSDNQSGGVTAGIINGPVTINNPAATPSRENFHEKIPDTVFLELGSNTMASLTTASLELPTAINLGGYVPFKLHIKNGILYCDVVVLGGAGQPPIEIKDNEFTVRPTNWDRNSSENAFEVVNENGDPVLQLIRKSAGRYAVTGYFPFPGGLIVVTNDNMTIKNNPPPGTTLPKLAPIFRYPSWKHSGQYLDN